MNTNMTYLKNATRRLIKKAGGVEGAALVTRVGKSSLGNYGNVNMPHDFMPLDVVIDLESDTQSFDVTQAMARLSGGYFVHLGQSGRFSRVTLAAHLSHISKEISDVFMGVSDLLVKGETASHQDRQDLLQEIDEAIFALADAKAMIEKE